MLETQQPTPYGEETGVEDRTCTACPRWVWTPAQAISVALSQAQWPRALGWWCCGSPAAGSQWTASRPSRCLCCGRSSKIHQRGWALSAQERDRGDGAGVWGPLREDWGWTSTVGPQSVHGAPGGGSPGRSWPSQVGSPSSSKGSTSVSRLGCVPWRSL